MQAIDAAKLLNEFKDTITTQLRSLGVVLHDDAHNLIRPGSGEEKRIVGSIARNLLHLLVLKEESCQTPVAGSNEYTMMTPEEQWEYDKARGRLDDEG